MTSIHNQNPRLFYTSVSLGGISLGWMMGLSASPVIQGVITALLTLLTTVAIAMSRVQHNDAQTSEAKERRRMAPPSAVPVSLLMIGIAIGASIGVIARTHDWLGQTIKQPSESDDHKTNHIGLISKGVLFSGTVTAEDRMRLLTITGDKEFSEQLGQAVAANTRLVEFIRQFPNQRDLRTLLLVEEWVARR